MQKRIKTLLKDNILFIAISVTFFIAFLSLIKVPKMSYGISHLDKYQHVFAYFILTISWLFTIKKRTNNRVKHSIVISCIIYGIILEVLQTTLTSFRTGDYLDIIANLIGVLLALLIFNKILKKNSVI